MTGGAGSALHVVLHGEIDANAIDGSSIWLVSLAELLASSGLRVTVLLRSPIERETLLEPLRCCAGLRLLDPASLGIASLGPARRPNAAAASRALLALHARDPFDALVVRGSRTAFSATFRPALRKRLWAYLTDIPQAGEPASLRRRLRVRRIGAAAHRLLCQTPELAERLLRLSPGAGGRLVALPPMIPDAALAAGPRPAPAAGERPLLVYVGKFARLWNTIEMTALPEALRRAALDVDLHVVGDRFQDDGDPGFGPAMRRALEATPGIVWHRGMARAAAMRIARAAHVGLGWRHEAMDRSVELSTKVIDYGAAGLPVLLNPTDMHRRLFGEDYPLFARTAEDAVGALKAVLRQPTLYERAARRTHDVARQHAFSVVAQSLVPELRKAPHG